MPLSPQEHAGYYKAAIESAQDKLNVCIPVTVQAVNGRFVDVSPDIYRGPMLPDRTRDYKQTEIIYNIPVVSIGCQNSYIQFPINVGCRGLIWHCDYDIDNWLVNDPIPFTARTHDLSDCFFIPTFFDIPFDGSNGETVNQLRLVVDGVDVIEALQNAGII